MEEQNTDSLRLENQVCFPLYAAARDVIRKYSPRLKQMGLTYTQYIVMMVMWERRAISVGELGRRLRLDTGTLSPLLKSMEEKGLVKKSRSKSDERIVSVEVTQAGERLKAEAADLPGEIRRCVELTDEEIALLYKLLYKLLDGEEKPE